MTKRRNRSGSSSPSGERPPEVRRASIRQRMLLVGAGLGLGMIAATLQVGVLQVAEGDALRREATSNYSRTVELDARRGDVVDRDGALLAVTVHRWAVTADPTRVDKADAPEAARILSDLLGQDEGTLLDKLAGDRIRRGPAPSNDPPARFARRTVRPVARAVAEVFDASTDRIERKMGLLEYFYRMDQLRTRGVYPVVDALTRIAETTAEAIHAGADDLRFFPSRGRRFVYLARDVDDETARRVMAARDERRERCREIRRRGGDCSNPLRAVRLQQEPRRYYPKRELATQLVGLVGNGSNALDGIERAMDGVLSGGQHTTRVIRDRRGRRMFLEGIPEDAPLAAPGVELTIDQEIQSLAERELNHACEAAGARAGYAVVMHVETGEMLAAASYPTFNPNTYRQFFRDRLPLVNERNALGHAREDLDWAASWPGMDEAWPGQADAVVRERRAALTRRTHAFVEHAHHYPSAARHVAFQDAYEPGSIMKVFTLAAWLEEGVHPMDREYDLMDGAWEIEDVDDNVIHDDHHFDREAADVAYALKTSSNIVYGQMGLDLGAERLEDYLRAFGFGEHTASGFPGESAGLLRDAAEWRTVETANIAFGQGIAATGVQVVTALAALGNEGRRMRPLLVRRVLDAEGREIRSWEPQVEEQVVSPRTARTVLDIMRTVVEPGGTGTRAAIPEYPVAGKTGTGQKPHLRKKGYAENMWVGTFFGVAPVDDPELAVLVLVDEPQGKRYGGVVAAPAFREIMRGALHHLGAPSPFDTGRQVAWLDPDVLANRRAQRPEPRESLDDAAPPVDPDAAGDVPVPDFRGMTMDRVRRLASEVGLNVRLVGSGTARNQDRSPHERVPARSEVTVVFEPRAPGAETSGGATSSAAAGPSSARPPKPAGGAP
ncbi:MAG: penicillin-binding protein [Myxococcota bacterium]